MLIAIKERTAPAITMAVVKRNAAANVTHFITS
jgi:hypothetical protein